MMSISLTKSLAEPLSHTMARSFHQLRVQPLHQFKPNPHLRRQIKLPTLSL